MKKIFSFANGGFGNRIPSLLFGKALKKITNFDLEISWPTNNTCRASYRDIFEDHENVLDLLPSKFFDTYGNDPNNFEFIINDANISNYSKFKQVRSLQSFKNVNEIAQYFSNSTTNNLFLAAGPIIPDYFWSDEFLIKTLSEIKFKEEYYNIVNEFLSNIGGDFVGIHLRATDFPPNLMHNFNKIYEDIKTNKEQKYFICSDDVSIENKFKELSNVFVFPKNEYTKKINPNKDWTGTKGFVNDENNIALSYNVEIGIESIRGAIVDILLLSHAKKIIETRGSTFSLFARLLQQTYNL